MASVGLIGALTEAAVDEGCWEIAKVESMVVESMAIVNAAIECMEMVWIFSELVNKGSPLWHVTGPDCRKFS
jgi:hypothetical protein